MPKNQPMKTLNILLILLCILIGAESAKGSASVIAVPLSIGGKPIYSPNLLQSSAAKGFIIGRIEVLKQMETQKLLPGLGACQIYLMPDCRKSLTNQSPAALAMAERYREKLETKNHVIIWLEQPGDFAAYHTTLKAGSKNGGTQPPPPPENRLPGQAKSFTDDCDCEQEICISSDGSMSFSLSCGALGVTIGTSGAVSVQISGKDGSKVELPITK